MKITKLKVCFCDIEKTFQYFSEAIEDNGLYYYRVNDMILEINQYQYNMVIKNPKLYYFSTALWLHLQIQKREVFY